LSYTLLLFPVRCDGSDQQCEQYFNPTTTVYIQIEVLCDTDSDLYCDINETLNTVLQDLVISSNMIKVCTLFPIDESDTCVVQAFVLEQITSTPRTSQRLTRELFKKLMSNNTLLMVSKLLCYQLAYPDYFFY